MPNGTFPDWSERAQELHDYYLRLQRNGELDPQDQQMFDLTVTQREASGEVLPGLPEEREQAPDQE